MSNIAEVIPKLQSGLDENTVRLMESLSEGELESRLRRIISSEFHPMASECKIHNCQICCTKTLRAQDEAVVGMMMSGGGYRRV